MIRLAIVLALGASLSCAIPKGARPALVPPTVCPDGAPVQWLQHPACGRVCGYSCLPDRWKGLTRAARPPEG